MAEPSPEPVGAEPNEDEPLVGSDRVLAVLRELGRRPEGASLEELARAVRSPKPTVHRALGALRRAGFARLDQPGHYLLGDDFLQLAFSNHEARPDHLRAQPLLARLARRFGETSHYAVLDGRTIIYRAKEDPAQGAVRLTSVIGGRNPAHCTAVGKLLLSYELDDVDAVATWVDEAQLERRTARTKTSVVDLADDLALTRERGWAVEDGENEIGVACLAVPVFFGSPSRPSGAVSISAITYRTPLAELVAEVEEIRALVDSSGTQR